MLRMSTLIVLALAAVTARAQVTEMAKDQTGASATTASPAATAPAPSTSTPESAPAPAGSSTSPSISAPASSAGTKSAGTPVPPENTPQTTTKTGAGSAPRGGAEADDKFEIPPGWKTEVHDDETMYCRKEVEKGTRFKKKNCYTLEGLKFKVAQDQAQADDITRRARVCSSASSCASN